MTDERSHPNRRGRACLHSRSGCPGPGRPPPLREGRQGSPLRAMNSPQAAAGRPPYLVNRAPCGACTCFRRRSLRGFLKARGGSRAWERLLMLPHRSAPELPGFSVRGGRASISVGCRAYSAPQTWKRSWGTRESPGRSPELTQRPLRGRTTEVSSLDKRGPDKCSVAQASLRERSLPDRLPE